MTKCRCGARGDEGELVEHCVSKLDAPDDPRDHGWDAEPERVTTARMVAATRAAEARRQAGRRDGVQRKLAEAAGVSVDELRDALAS